MTADREYDVVIIGGGPAGLAAGVYAARGRRKTVLLEKGVIGGQIALTELVENYPGIKSINGFDLAQAMLEQAESYGMEAAYVEVSGIERIGDLWTVHTSDGDYTAKAIVMTAGADYNKLGVPGEEAMIGKGVSYCATCDAAFFKDLETVVVGGGDAALEEAIFTTRYATKVTLVHRRDELRGSAILQERAFANDKIEFKWNTVVTEILGDQQVTGAKLKDVVTGEESEMATSAVFIFIGQHPNTDFMGDLVPMDKGRHIIVDEWMRTPQPGLFAAGDVRQNSARQVASSVGDGVTAAIGAEHYIAEKFPDSPLHSAEPAETTATA
ncbi:MAG TPA: thioredoxin-disulfide reductase [Dehalococcoidia bacterium]